MKNVIIPGIDEAYMDGIKRWEARKAAKQDNKPAKQDNKPITETITSQLAKVEIVNIDMKFWSMVWFMVKWAFASIPALIIIVLIGFILNMVIPGLFLILKTLGA